MSTVAVDHELGAELATRHLIRLGHSRIGLIAESPTGSRGSAHHIGYARALTREGIELDEGLIEAAELTRPASGAEACAALTTVSLPLTTAGKEAAALILERLDNPDRDPRSVHLRPYSCSGRRRDRLQHSE